MKVSRIHGHLTGDKSASSEECMYKIMNHTSGLLLAIDETQELRIRYQAGMNEIASSFDFFLCVFYLPAC